MTVFGAALVTVLLSADGGTPWAAMVSHAEKRSAEVRDSCLELVASAANAEQADSVLAVRKANEAIDLAAPIGNEVSAFVENLPGFVDAGLVPSRRRELHDCVRSADFLVARVTHSNLRGAGDSASARKEAGALYREYLARYPHDGSAETVRGWLEELSARPAK